MSARGRKRKVEELTDEEYNMLVALGDPNRAVAAPATPAKRIGLDMGKTPEIHATTGSVSTLVVEELLSCECPDARKGCHFKRILVVSLHKLLVLQSYTLFGGPKSSSELKHSPPTRQFVGVHISPGSKKATGKQAASRIRACASGNVSTAVAGQASRGWTSTSSSIARENCIKFVPKFRFANGRHRRSLTRDAAARRGTLHLWRLPLHLPQGRHSSLKGI
ncbi:hypothetical protein EXIGLDRAFT_769126 [Exidia glandulosa HHB12029]|uniref:Uncharacterized protein n=1 Tax=Exidia glandulosa HHB12029 TaxID=1314781 RepID=A0A165HP56_EXIGL|nr:hypothetical protein EXIGLDRAFT_769126 [Exidia glandulosa HHB12029]